MSRQENRWGRKKKKVEAFLRLVKEKESCEEGRSVQPSIPGESNNSAIDQDHSKMARNSEGATKRKTAEDMHEKSTKKLKKKEPESENSDEDSDPQEVQEAVDSKKPKKKFVSMTQEELAKLRVELRERQKASMKKPKFVLTLEELSTYPGSPANVPLFILDIQHLLLYSLEGNATSYNPRWCRLLRWPRLQQVAVVVLNQVGQEDFIRNRHCFPFISKTFETQTELICPMQYGSSVARELFAVPMSISQFRKLSPKEIKSMQEDEAGARKKVSATENVVSWKVQVKGAAGSTSSDSGLRKEGEACSRASLLLSSEQMIVEGYPLPVSATEGQFADFVYSKDIYEELSPESPLYAVDCEMCITSKNKSELTRVAVINEDLEVIYETLVKPHNPITNYLTKYSGITKKLLKNVKTRIEDVQQKLQEILPADAILCGQSLNNDLRALKMLHPYVIDTSVIYNLTGLRRMKSSLRKLAAHFLGKDIQCSQKGHDPSEDARATMELVLLKLEQGMDFGDLILGGIVVSSEQRETESPDRQREEAEPRSDDADSSDSESSQVKVRSDEGQSEGKGQLKSELKEKSLSEVTTRKEVFFKRPGLNLMRSFFRMAQERKKSVALVGPEAMLDPYTTHPVTLHPATRDSKAVKQAKSIMADHKMVYTQLDGYSSLEEEDTLEAKQAAMVKLDKQVKKVAKCLRPYSLLLVLMSGRVSQTEINNALCFVNITGDEGGDDCANKT